MSSPNHVFRVTPTSTPDSLRAFVAENRVTQVCRGYAIGTEVSERWNLRLQAELERILAEAKQTRRHLVTYVVKPRRISLRFQ